MQDVADVLGLAKGTLYGYAASKDALFAAAVRYGDDLDRYCGGCGGHPPVVASPPAAGLRTAAEEPDPPGRGR
jgi:hypothetical protein